MEVFQDYAHYYNLFYQHKEYIKEAQTISTLLQMYGTNRINSILNLGCGTGKHDIQLSKMGYEIVGVDMSCQMISEAVKNSNAENCNIPFMISDIREFDPQKQFDAVTSLFHVISYQNHNLDVTKTFSTAYKALKNNGIFLFDVWYGPGVLTDRPAVRVRKAEDETHTLYRIAEPCIHANENIVDVNYEILAISKSTGIVKQMKELHKMRYFFKPELEFYLNQSGFRLITCVDCNTLETPDFNSWTAYFVAQKREE